MPCIGAEGISCNSYYCKCNLSNENYVSIRQEPIDVTKVNKKQLMENIELNKLQKENKFLEAGLCALITEIEKINLSEDLINKASINGQIDLHKFWEQHKQNDIERLKLELQKFSSHELEVIKQILKL